MLQQALLIGIMMMWDDTMMQQWMELKGELLYTTFSLLHVYVHLCI